MPKHSACLVTYTAKFILVRRMDNSSKFNLLQLNIAFSYVRVRVLVPDHDWGSYPTLFFVKLL